MLSRDYHVSAATSRARSCIFAALLVLDLVFCLEPQPAVGQVATTITPSGLGTRIAAPKPSVEGLVHEITGGTRVETNLYHGFGRFNLASGELANFFNDSGLATSNIFGRVVDGQPSLIFGTLRTTDFPGANLYLMNPAGILFGSTARLDLGAITGQTTRQGGSFFATTADYIRLADGAQFHANPAEPRTAFSAAPAVAFGFLVADPAAISIQGTTIQVAESQTIGLIGGNRGFTTPEGETAPSGVTLARGTLSAPGGQVHLASIASEGEILTTGLEPHPNQNGTMLSSFGPLRLVDTASVDVTGTPSGSVILRGDLVTLDNVRVLSTNRGDIAGGNITLDGTQVLLTNRARIAANSSSSGDAGSVFVSATDQITLLQNSSISGSTRLEGAGGLIQLQAPIVEFQGGSNLTTATTGIGKAGDIALRAAQVTLSDHSVLSASTQAEGQAGNITITGLTGPGSRSDAITLLQGSQLFSETIGTFGGEGDGGTIQVNTARLSLSESLITTSSRASTGSAGSILLDASESITVDGRSVVSSGSVEFASGNGGLISLRSPQVTIQNGASVSTSTESDSDGHAGSITINTSSLQLLSGGTVSSSSLVVDPDFPPTGHAGNVTVKGLASPAQSVLIDGAGSGIFTDTQGTGAGGAIRVETNNLTMQNGGTLSASTSGTDPAAAGGDVRLSIPQNLVMVNGASITTKSTGPADAGSIIMEDPRPATITMTDSAINANASVAGTAASGGNISLLATNTIRLLNSQINTSVVGNENTVGGTIFIDPQLVFLQNSQILATAVQGQGGNIRIVAGTFLADPSSSVSASSQLGINGTVDIRATVQNLSGALVPLQQDFLAGGSLVAQRCAARATDGQGSSFILAGREGIPAEPDGSLASPLEPRLPSGGSPLVMTPLPPTAPAILLAAGPGSGTRSADRPIQAEDFTGACRR